MARYWKEKLIDFSDKEIADALMLHSGEFFPSVDEVIRSITRMRERKAEEKSAISQETVRSEREKIEQFMAEHGGKTPMQVWCEENPTVLRKLDMALISSEPSRSPRNVAALSQAKALRTAGRPCVDESQPSIVGVAASGASSESTSKAESKG